MPIDPKAQTLTNGQSQQFTLVDAEGAPVVPGAGGTIAWAATPPEFANALSTRGSFTAPAVVDKETTVTITATPPGGSPEQATVRLVPLAVILIPAKVGLREGEAQQFDATVPGDPANAVRWNIAPTLGTIVDGRYTAPATNREDREVQVTAASLLDPRKSATATVQLQAKPPRWQLTTGLFCFLVGIFSSVVLLVSLWPPNATADPVNPTWWFKPIPREIDLLWLVLITGALGSFAYSARSFVDFVGNRALRASWSAWYLMYPFIGAALALIFYLAVRGGFMTPGSSKDVNVFGLAAISGLVGMFSKQATTKLGELFSTLFKTDKDDKALKNKLS